MHFVSFCFKDELEWFERKQRGKKRRPRKQVEEIRQPSLIVRHGRAILLTAAAAAIIALLMYIATTWSASDIHNVENDKKNNKLHLVLILILENF